MPKKNVDLSASAIRAWAKENGYSVGVRGRLAAEVVSAYRASNGLK